MVSRLLPSLPPPQVTQRFSLLVLLKNLRLFGDRRTVFLFLVLSRNKILWKRVFLFCFYLSLGDKTSIKRSSVVGKYSFTRNVKCITCVTVIFCQLRNSNLRCVEKSSSFLQLTTAAATTALWNEAILASGSCHQVYRRCHCPCNNRACEGVGNGNGSSIWKFYFIRAEWTSWRSDVGRHTCTVWRGSHSNHEILGQVLEQTWSFLDTAWSCVVHSSASN